MGINTKSTILVCAVTIVMCIILVACSASNKEINETTTDKPSNSSVAENSSQKQENTKNETESTVFRNGDGVGIIEEEGDDESPISHSEGTQTSSAEKNPTKSPQGESSVNTENNNSETTTQSTTTDTTTTTKRNANVEWGKPIKCESHRAVFCSPVFIIFCDDVR